MSIAALIAAGLAATSALLVAVYLMPQLRAVKQRSGNAGALARRLSGRLPEEFKDRVRLRIVQAGGLDGLTPAQLVLRAANAALFGLALGAMLVISTGWPPWSVMLVCVGGAALPFIWLRDRVKQRHADILEQLPFHLDLLTLCVEAGLDFGAGVARTVERGRPGALREELNAYLSEVRIGKTRAEALQALGDRVGLPQLSTFIAALVQADRMGVGLGQTLRQQAEQLRLERRLRAETLAHEAPVKMLIPLVLFIFPTIWVILSAPLIFRWVILGG